VIEERLSGCPEVVLRLDLDVGQVLGLVHVRGDDRGEGQKLVDQRVDGRILEQLEARLRDHDRVHDEREQVVGRHAVGYRFDDLRSREHARLGRLHVHVLGHGVNLRGHERGRQVVGLRHFFGVLGRYGGEGGGAEDAVGLHRLEVGLNAGAAARVAAGNGESNRLIGHG
jgi:hypothetical protein